MMVDTARRPHHDHHTPVQETDRHASDLTVVETQIVEIKARSSENEVRLEEVETALPKGRVPLRRVENDRHTLNVAT